MSELIFKRKYSSVFNYDPCDAETYILSCLDGNEYDRGAIETAHAQADNVSEAFSRLVQILFDKNLLAKKDVKIVGSWDGDE